MDGSNASNKENCTRTLLTIDEVKVALTLISSFQSTRKTTGQQMQSDLVKVLAIASIAVIKYLSHLKGLITGCVQVVCSRQQLSWVRLFRFKEDACTSAD